MEIVGEVEKKFMGGAAVYNPGQDICDTFNYLTKFRNIIAKLENLPLTPTNQRPTLFWGWRGGGGGGCKRVNYSGLIGTKATKECFNRVSQMVLSRIQSWTKHLRHF